MITKTLFDIQHKLAYHSI